MRGPLRSVLFAVMVATASAGTAEEPPRDCLPSDLKLRVAFAEPKRLADALREIDAERRRAGKREVLKRRFLEAGCSTVEEQAGEGFAEPNLICRIPGASEATIAIGSSATVDGWPAVAMLPEIARAVAATPRAHTYAIASLSRGATETPVGSRAFAHSFAKGAPLIFVHAGMLGSGSPQLGPEIGDDQRCLVESISRALTGAPLSRMLAWDQIGGACFSPGGNRYSGGTESLRACQGGAFSRQLDIDPFLKRDVEVAGFYAYPKRDKTNFSLQRSPRLDPAAYVASYRVIAAYAVALDEALVAPVPAAD